MMFCLLPFPVKRNFEILYLRISLSSHSPVYCGALFSLNARRPSSLSLVGMTCQPKTKMVFVSNAVSVEKFGVKRVDKDQMSQLRSQGLSSCGKT